MRHASTIILTLLLSGCAQQQPVRVDTPRTEGPDKNYSVDLPLGWVKQQLTDKTMLASRDGPLLEAIYISRRTAKEAFPRFAPVGRRPAYQPPRSGNYLAVE